MESPPRPILRPSLPTTPTKPLRQRPRIQNRVVRQRCRRCLFGRPDHDELTSWLQNELRVLNEEQCQKWDFNFATMTPLAGGSWEWEKAPLSKDPETNAGHSRRFAPQSPLAAAHAGFSFPPSGGVTAASPDDVFARGSEAAPLTPPPKRARTSVRDENSNPLDDSSSLPLPFAAHASIVRTASVSEGATPDISDVAFDIPAGATEIPAEVSIASTTSTPVRPHNLRRAAPTPSSRLSPEPTPPRLTRSSHHASRKNSVASVEQKRLGDFFPVKRRCVDGSAGGGGVDGRKKPRKLVFDA